MLAQRKYDSRVASSCCVIAAAPSPAARRDGRARCGTGSPARRAAPGCRPRGLRRTTLRPVCACRASATYLSTSPRATGRRNARRARSVDDARRARRPVLAVAVTADVDLRACSSRDGPVTCAYGPADVDRADAHAVQRNLLQLRLASSKRLRSWAIRSGVASGRRRERLARRLRPRRRVRPADSAPAVLRRCAGSRPRSSARRPSASRGTARAWPPKSCRSSANVADRSAIERQRRRLRARPPTASR